MEPLHRAELTYAMDRICGITGRRNFGLAIDYCSNGGVPRINTTVRDTKNIEGANATANGVEPFQKHILLGKDHVAIRLGSPCMPIWPSDLL
jgi:hypothetical protein